MALGLLVPETAPHLPGWALKTKEKLDAAEATIATLREEVERLTARLAEEGGYIDRIAKALTEPSHPQAARINAVGVLDKRQEMLNYRTSQALSPPQASTTTQGGEG